MDELNELRNDFEVMEKEHKEFRHSVNNRLQDLLLEQTTFVKRGELDKFYTKGEMDRMLKTIEEYTGGVKQLLELHVKYVDKEIIALRGEQDIMKKGAADKTSMVISIAIGFILTSVVQIGMFFLNHVK